jgi:hypothetical protein
MSDRLIMDEPVDHRLGPYSNLMLMALTGRPLNETYHNTAAENQVIKRRTRTKLAKRSRRINRRRR